MGETEEPSFADMAVALTLASSKLHLDLVKTKIVADRIGLSKMGYELIVPQFEQDLALIDAAMQLLKDLSSVEAEVRAVVGRKKTSRWSLPFSSVTKAAVL